MIRSWFCGVGLATMLLALALPCVAAAPDGATGGASASLLEQAVTAASKNDSRGAVALLDRYITSARKSAEKDAAPELAEAYYLRGCEQFRLGQIDESVADLDRAAKLAPEREREMWERGISDYYAGKFAAGAKQFELYQTYHDNDVENSTWRYLCIARSEGVAKARASLLPIKNDRRVPMMQIFALYEGKLKPDDVLAAASAGKPDESELKPRLFYAHLYIGLWYEAAGDSKAAREHLALAADKYRIAHYMGDVARVHLDRLDKAKAGSPATGSPAPEAPSPKSASSKSASPKSASPSPVSPAKGAR
jgi:lipoprotein NlpI